MAETHLDCRRKFPAGSRTDVTVTRDHARDKRSRAPLHVAYHVTVPSKTFHRAESLNSDQHTSLPLKFQLPASPFPTQHQRLSDMYAA